MPFIFSFYFLKKNKSRELKVFFVYTILLISLVLIFALCRYIFKSHQAYLIFERLFIIAEFALISRFFILNISESKLKKVINLLIIPIVLFSVYDYVSSFNQDFTYYPLVLECLLFPLVIILFFYEKMKYSTQYPIYLSPAFWIAVAFLIFSTGNFFLFLFSKMLLQNAENKKLYNDIYGFFTILKNILLCVAVIVFKNSEIKNETSDINVNLELETFIPYNNQANL
jgi:hypothetical protein